jgi:hypothetical protein
MKRMLASLLICSAGGAWAAQPPTDPLYDEIAAMDSVLFDAFNRKDLEAVHAVFSRDLEFYHDKGGLQNFEQNRESSRRLFQADKTLKRQLVPGSMEVFPVKDYGAIQTGQHKFCKGPTSQDDCGVFKFLHIWQRVDGRWKLARVVSYGH